MKLLTFIHSPFMQRLDWVLAIGSLMWGMVLLISTHALTFSTALWFVGGGIGLLLAYLKPAQRLQTLIQRRFVRKAC